MDKVLDLQMSLFGSFESFKPNTDTMIQLLNALKDESFIPGSTDIVRVDIGTGKLIVDTRIQMVSTNKLWNIAILPDRIDFNYLFNDGTTLYKNISDILKYGRKLIKKVFSVLQGNGSRLAVSCHLLFGNMIDHEEMERMCSLFATPLSVYGKKPMKEWSVRFNSCEKLQISDSLREECNRIVEIAMAESPEKSIISSQRQADMFVTIDFNTSENLMTSRFSYRDLICFSSYANTFAENVINEIEGIIA